MGRRYSRYEWYELLQKIEFAKVLVDVVQAVMQVFRRAPILRTSSSDSSGEGKVASSAVSVSASAATIDKRDQLVNSSMQHCGTQPRHVGSEVP